MPDKWLAGKGGQRLAGESAGPKPGRDDHDNPLPYHDAIVRSPRVVGNRIGLVLFDLDGVLLDTRAVMGSAWRQVQRVHRIDVPFEAYAAHSADGRGETIQGHKRIQGELIGLGRPGGGVTVWLILHRAGIDPVPGRPRGRGGGSWTLTGLCDPRL
ncbi:MAG: hypothetical protein L0Y54_17595 [Sporichthyaceae bacterium]|nr:hypothetical protein [Sporichthyaceae bacterium]